MQQHLHHSSCTSPHPSFHPLRKMSKLQRFHSLYLRLFHPSLAPHHSPTRGVGLAQQRRPGIWRIAGRFVSTQLAAQLRDDHPPDFARKRLGKAKTFYVCENCGEPHSQWWGYCKSCKQANALKKFTEYTPISGPGGGAAVKAVEGLGLGLGTVTSTKLGNGAVEVGSSGRVPKAWIESRSQSKPQRLSDVAKGISQVNWRIPMVGTTGAEVSRVLGGGLVPGCLVLVGGDPGVGKSTLLLQVAGLVSMGSPSLHPAPVLYVSGEESMEQISNRADRLKIPAKELFLYAATDLEAILNAIQELSPRVVVVDSIQTIYLQEASGSAGSVTQVRECATALLRCAKQLQVPTFLVGHTTKTGDIAGPKVLEHIVDVVLYLEGERLQSHRLLRVVKNRYGSTDEVGVFEMAEGGLVAVTNPSGMFLSERTSNASNAASGAVAVTMEGSRPLLLEVQALCSNAIQTPPKRTANGIDPQRFSLIIAVLTKQARVRLSNQDIFINVVGGFELKEPAADVAVALAICSSYLEKPLPHDMAFIGEIGLAGELRSVGQLERRLMEALKLGFKRFVIPQSAAKVAKGILTEGSQTISCSDIIEVLDKVLGFKSQNLPGSHNGAENSHSSGKPNTEPNNGLISWMQHGNEVENMAATSIPLGQIPAHLKDHNFEFA